MEAVRPRRLHLHAVHAFLFVMQVTLCACFPLLPAHWWAPQCYEMSRQVVYFALSYGHAMQCGVCCYFFSMGRQTLGMSWKGRWIAVLQESVAAAAISPMVASNAASFPQVSVCHGLLLFAVLSLLAFTALHYVVQFCARTA